MNYPFTNSTKLLNLEELNDQQQRAVFHAGNPLLILAGAGSGKTRVITTKIAHLIAEKAVSADQILAVTFTNKAAEEMRVRVQKLVGKSSTRTEGDRVTICTFHAFGAWLLRIYGEHLGFRSRQLSIYDDVDARQVVQRLVKDDREGYLISDIRDMAAWIATAKNYGLSYTDDLTSLRRSLFPMENIYKRYQDRLASLNAVDFGDLILLPLMLIRNNEEVRQKIHNRFQVLLVDEFQDANRAQFELLQVLYQPPNYLCVVGDDDQSIYRFRGADVDGFLTFPQRFSGTEVVRLEQNYRSTGAILQLASTVVSHNHRRMTKTLWTEQERGCLPTLSFLSDAEEEARHCVDLVCSKPNISSAVLYRMNFQSRTFETMFQSLHIPYRILGTVRFYDREEIKDSLAYLGILYNPKDEVAFRRAVSKPRRGIGAKTIVRIVAAAAEMEGNLLRATAVLSCNSSGRSKISLEKFAALMNDLEQLLTKNSLADLVRALLNQSGLYEQVVAQDRLEHTTRVMNLEELINATIPYGVGASAMSAFLEDVRLAGVDSKNSIDQHDGKIKPVTLVTAHNTKGLEFDQVIVTGLEEGIFPATSPINAHIAMTLEEEEEERRLFYVAVTRARQFLHLTSCSRRTAFGFSRERDPSRFLMEIPRECVSVSGNNRSETLVSGFREGHGVEHIDYGVGIVIRRWIEQGQQMLEVSFRSGKTATFFADYAGLDAVSIDE